MKTATNFRCMLFCLMLGIGLCGCKPEGEESQLVADLAQAYSQLNSESDKLTLAHITHFTWDRLIVFPPNTSIAEIHKSLGLEVPENILKIGLEQRDDIHLMIFLSGRTITQISAVPRKTVDFMNTLANINLSRANAVFAKAFDEKSLALAALN